MRKNIFWAMCFLFLWTKTLFAGFLIGSSIGTYPDTKNRQNPLVSGTTAAFSVYLTSTNVTGTTTGRWTMYASSFTLEQLNSNGGATTNYFNVLLSTSDTIFNCINRINEIPNWTATLCEGCYGLQYAAGSASVRVDSEGTTDGLQYDATGKSVSFSTGSINAMSIYFNATQYLSKYFEPVQYKQYEVYDINTSLASGTTMYIFEGVKSTDTTALIAISHYDINEREYPIFAPLTGSVSQALEYRVVFGTWTTSTDRIQIFLNNR